MERSVRVAIAISMLASFGWACAPRPRTVPYPDQKAGLSAGVSNSVKILFERDRSTFPPEWEEMVTDALPEFRRARVTRTIQREMSKYPAELLESELLKVYVFERMAFQGLDYGGTYEPFSQTVYLVEVPWEPDFVGTSLHHELASILLVRNPPSFKGAWKRLNKYRDYAYDYANIEAVKEGRAG